MAYVVYLAISLDVDFRYVGLPDNPTKRLQWHNAGYVKSTASHGPIRMILLRHCSTRDEARKAEKVFKSGQGRRMIERLLAKERALDIQILDAEKEGFIRNPTADGESASST
jgi:predicted GIY-YIG superfamily endonuclease